jgi:hypothetical protein
MPLRRQGSRIHSELETSIRLMLWGGYKNGGGREDLQVNVGFVSLRMRGGIPFSAFAKF